MDHAKCGYKDEAALAIAHGACDEGYLIKTNRMLATILHEAVFPRGSKLYMGGDHVTMTGHAYKSYHQAEKST